MFSTKVGVLLTPDKAREIAKAVAAVVGPRLKAVQVQAKLHEGVVNVKVFLRPLISKEVPEPEWFLYNSEDLNGESQAT